ncbi:hypothetical protein N7478_001936 [Penicillium angulare]|uniref:uncharacterized protein n=1 Tax=Penicillium angulare TaxID=116970 RepID=UPI0025409550|nr:uncharacterized protein N7478_001936 [Penicillium angulare]KAJ5288906.1 hypothetical protein N7478_001936 [Penicillium angulare]
MDTSVQFTSDKANRRRTQNRLAQRKFREKKRRITDNHDADVHTTQEIAETFNIASQPTPTTNNSSSSANSLPSVANATELAGALSSDEIPIIINSPEPIDNFDFNFDPISQLLNETNDQNLFQLLDQSHSAIDDRPSRHTIPGSDIRQSSPGSQITQPRSAEAMFGLITSARSDKGWISTLHIAAQKGHENIIRMLLLRKNSDVNKHDSDGRTPLMHAIIENHKSVVGLLLSHGAIIGLSDCDGRSALHWAVLYQRTDILHILLEHHAKYERSLDIDAPDNKGWTPLHISVTRAFEDGVLILLQEGADINAIAHKCPYTGKVMPSVDRQS